MTTKQEIEKPSAQVPDLVRTPALELTAEDVALPRLYIGQFMSQHVQDGNVPAGAIFTALGQEDPDPEVLWEPGDEAGIRLHILDLKLGKSLSIDGELQLYDHNDPEAPPEAWTTYNYAVALPDVDQEVPYKWLLTRSAKATAKQINMVLMKHQAKGPAYEVAFEIETAPRENQKGKWFVPRARSVEAKDEHVKIAESLVGMISGAAVETSSNDEPDI